MESIITYGIIYLLVFRLAVLLLGGLCIFCGYRLFLVRWQRKGGADEQGGELSGKISGSELTIKSAAPGIFFSAFGAVIVIAVLAGNQPDVKYEEKEQGSPQPGGQSTAGCLNAEFFQPQQSAVQLKTAASRAPENPDYHDLLARLYFALEQAGQRVALKKLRRRAGLTFRSVWTSISRR